MRTTLIALTWIVLAASAAGCGAAPPPPGASALTVTSVRGPGEAQVGDRTTCPVAGEEFIVSATSPRVEHEGKTYFFCCADCAQKFTAEPGKYLREAKR